MTEALIKELHRILKTRASYSRKHRLNVGNYIYFKIKY